MVTVFRLFLSCLIALSITIPIYAADNAEHQERLSKHYRLKKPEGAGPFPAVMMVPGLSEFDVFYDSVQNQLVELGFVTLRVDYLAARNISGYDMAVSSEEVAADIGIAAEYLKKQAYIKKGSLNVLVPYG